jgi:DNA-binding MarR family transcriptional regulator
MHYTRTENLFGAAALAAADLLVVDATRTSGTSVSGAAALVVLAAGAPIGVTELGRRVGLTQSAAARMVDSLQAAGLAARQPGSGRDVAVHLTQAGGRATEELLAARAAALAGVLDVLDPDERATLAGLLAKLLPRLYERIGSAELLCRLCDRAVCTKDAVCPVGQAERDRRS